MNNAFNAVAICIAILIILFSPFVKDLKLALCEDEINFTDESSVSQWKEESGYCNCLLVTMSRVQIRSLELRSDSRLPDLEKLAAARNDTSAWIKAQGFDYSRLDSQEVISLLMDSAGLPTDSLVTQYGSIEAIDLVGSNGPEVKRRFNLTFSDIEGVWILKIELRNYS